MANELQTRTTVFALVEEVTEGTPVAPSAVTDFVAFQEGFDIEPSFVELENAELQASIGTAKTSLGFEEPSATASHYLRHSGVEGQEPNFKLLLKSALGTSSVNGTERTTTAASTTSLIKLAAGGTDFSRGSAVLIKDITNGYSIRNVLTVATNDLTLAQNVANAPATGINVGKNVKYSVADSGWPTLSLWGYRSNGGATELISGTRVTEMTIDITAGEFINGSFTMEGIKYIFDPITVAASNKYLDFSDSGPTTFAVSIEEKTYKDPYDLATTLQAAMNGTATVDAYTVTYDDSTRKFTIASDNATFSILWKTGTHGSDNADDHIGTLLGYDDSADDVAQSNISDTAQDWSASFTPSYDSADPLVAKSNTILIGESDEITCFGAQSVSINLTNTKSDITDVCADTGKSGSQFTKREVTVDVVSYLATGQAEEFKRYRANDEIVFTYNCGEKSAGNWIAGKAVNIHMPTAKISAFKLGDSDGIVTLEMTLKAFVSNSLGEFYLNFL